ncbi:hypothetical protein BDQ17DRAFT_1334129 [Cyathus striatus]|nr:hypothetical protein BDQ17DRAFT_1334129 [Cyathus striatus]
MTSVDSEAKACCEVGHAPSSLAEATAWVVTVKTCTPEFLIPVFLTPRVALCFWKNMTGLYTGTFENPQRSRILTNIRLYTATGLFGTFFSFCYTGFFNAVTVSLASTLGISVQAL